MIAPVFTWWLTSQQGFNAALAAIPSFQAWGIVRETDGVWMLWLPWQMIAYIVVGFAAGIIASLITRPVSTEKVERYYQLLRTPVSPDEVIKEPCTLPEGVEPGPRRVFFPNSNLEIPVPSRRAMLGLLAGWACVFAIIGSVVIWIAD
jgi:hypothetical protein